jgi:hypothetical protein
MPSWLNEGNLPRFPRSGQIGKVHSRKFFRHVRDLLVTIVFQTVQARRRTDFF